jgi:hypothetical protein
MKLSISAYTRACVSAVIVVLACAAVPSVGAAVEDPLVRPSQISPVEGQQITAGTPVVFRIQTTPEETHNLWLHVSTSPVAGAGGVIASDTDIERFSVVPGQPGVFEAAPRYAGFPSFWMNTPGTYYWQAFRIHCYDATGPPDCTIESTVRTLVITQRPVTAQILGVGPPQGCYVTRSRVHVTATGFRPGAGVDLKFDGRYAAGTTADAFGNVDTSVSVPSPGSGPMQRRYSLSVTERDFPANTAAVNLLVANLAFKVTPFAFVRRGRKVLFQFSGMVQNRPVYAHYRLGGRTRANVRLGIARGPCGLLTVRAPMIPAGITRRGTWTVQFDAVPRYVATANPRLRGTIVVRTVLN